MKLLRITRFEQSAFLFESHDGTRLAIDVGSYSSEESVFAVGHVDAAIVSHFHDDHFHFPHLKALGGKVFCPSDVARRLPPNDLDIHVVEVGQDFEVGAFRIKALPANHGAKVTMEPGSNVGFVLETTNQSSSPDKYRIYFAGDMGGSIQLPPIHVDAVLVPFSLDGYVFSPEQAADFIRELGHQGLIIPMHFEPELEEPIQRFKASMSAQGDVRVLAVGESLEF